MKYPSVSVMCRTSSRVVFSRCSRATSTPCSRTPWGIRFQNRHGPQDNDRRTFRDARSPCKYGSIRRFRELSFDRLQIDVDDFTALQPVHFGHAAVGVGEAGILYGAASVSGLMPDALCPFTVGRISKRQPRLRNAEGFL